MGLKIKPKSKLRALQCRIYSLNSLQMAMRTEPVVIPWDRITEIVVTPHPSDPQYHVHFKCEKNLESVLHFQTSEVMNFSEFDSYLNTHPIKKRESQSRHLREHKYGTITTKYVIGILALTFMFFQFKYFGSLLILKYQFLIKASCNQQCAQELWSISLVWFYFVLACISPIVPVLFYKKIYTSALRSQNVQMINSTLAETSLLAILGFILLAAASPKLWESTSRYSNIIVSYTNNSLETKLSQKIEMASKREFQGDIDEAEDYDLYEDQHEE